MNHSPISQCADQKPVRWRLLGYVGVLTMLTIYGAMQVKDEMTAAQAAAKDKAETDRRIQQALIEKQALQMNCGGPEATVTARPRGGWKCQDTNGRTTKIMQRSNS